MTNLATRKNALNVETSAEKREGRRLRPILLEFDSAFTMNVRLKGTRYRLPISFEAIYDAAAKIEARRVRAEKIAARKAKKGGR